MIEFFCPMVPPRATAQQKRVAAGGRVYEDGALAEARDKLLGAFQPHAPSSPMDGALELELVFCFPTRGARRQFEPKTTRPDCDNMAKVPTDCLQRLGFIADDARIWHLDVRKVWADPAGIFVRIRETARDG